MTRLITHCMVIDQGELSRIVKTNPFGQNSVKTQSNSVETPCLHGQWQKRVETNQPKNQFGKKSAKTPRLGQLLPQSHQPLKYHLTYFTTMQKTNTHYNDTNKLIALDITNAITIHQITKLNFNLASHYH